MKVLDTNIAFAVRCANCGRIKIHNISTFEISSGEGGIDLKCDCGSVEMTAVLKDRRSILISLPCIACDISHTYMYNLKDIMKRRVSVACCRETGLELCFLGGSRGVRDMVLKYEEDLTTLLGELGLYQDLEDDVLKGIINRKGL